ncbi:hypothetical protein Tco_0845707 [Tanacetum coccineum]
MEGLELSLQERESKLYNDFDKFTSEEVHTSHPSQYNPQSSVIPQQQQSFTPLQQQQFYSPPFHQETYQAPVVHQQAYEAPIVHHQSPIVFSQLDSSLAVPKFLPSDDPIESLNKAMAFLSTANTLRYAQTKNQLRTSYNTRNQATIQDVHTSHPSQYNPQSSVIPQQQQSFTPLQQQQFYSPPFHQETYQAPVVHQQAYEAPVVHHQLPIVFSQLDSDLVVPKFLPTDDPIESLNKAMAFLSTANTLRYAQTKNQLRTSYNTRNQATIQDGRVTVQNVQGRQTRGYAGNVVRSNATGTRIIQNRGNATANQSNVI